MNISVKKQNLFSLVIKLLCYAKWYYGMLCFCNIKKTKKKQAAQFLK